MPHPKAKRPAQKIKNVGGRPLKLLAQFKNVKGLQKAIDAYFAECDLEEDTRVYRHAKTIEWSDPADEKAPLESICTHCKNAVRDKYDLPTQGCVQIRGRLKKAKPYTVTGLALALGLDDIETIKNYKDTDRSGFSCPIKAAYLKVQGVHEANLHESNIPPAKTIFALTNFKGWENKQRNVNDNNNRHSGKLSLEQLLSEADDE